MRSAAVTFIRHSSRVLRSSERFGTTLATGGGVGKESKEGINHVCCAVGEPEKARVSSQPLPYRQREAITDRKDLPRLLKRLEPACRRTGTGGQWAAIRETVTKKDRGRVVSRRKLTGKPRRMHRAGGRWRFQDRERQRIFLF